MVDDAEGLAALAEQALAARCEEAALPRLQAWLARHPNDATLLHWSAMLHRALDDRAAAIAALERARGQAPESAGIAHALAHTTLEAGLPASALFERAIMLAPADGTIHLGLGAARLAEGEGERALAELRAMLDANPGWYDGHRQYAQLSGLTGRRKAAYETIGRAIERFPDADALHQLAIDLLFEAEDHEGVLDAVRRAARYCPDTPTLLLAHAVALDELGRLHESAPLFARLGPPQDSAQAIRGVRHSLRTGALARAGAELERWLDPAAPELWPYAAIVWRLLEDPRSEWLQGEPSLVRVVDLPDSALALPPLTALLRRLHGASGRFLGQSVRGGTQTDGHLLARIDPDVATARETLRGEVRRYLDALPRDAAHPTFREPRTARPRFAGSWSVRLRETGFHSAHQHPQGRVSSALYVTVPQAPAGQRGTLELGGAPAGLGIDLEPLVTVEPEPGRLVLFPSWMWHATRRYPAGERITIAFDIAPA